MASSIRAPLVSRRPSLGTARAAAHTIGSPSAAANAARAHAHDATPDGTTGRRIADRENGDRARIARSNRADGSGFFQNPPPPDGPRTSFRPALRQRPGAAPAPAAGTGRPAAAGRPSRARSSGTAPLPAIATSTEPPPDTPARNTAPEGAAAETAARTLSRDTTGCAEESPSGRESRRLHSAKNNRHHVELAAPLRSRHLEVGPTGGLCSLVVKSRRRVPALLRGVILPPSRPTLFRLATHYAGYRCPAGPPSAARRAARDGPLLAQKWPPFKPLLTANHPKGFRGLRSVPGASWGLWRSLYGRSSQSVAFRRQSSPPWQRG
jgi:hypothetical protein